MFTAKKYIVLADIESVRIPYSTFAKALNELSNYGEIAACKFYGYSSKRSKDYDEFIAENNFDALSLLPKKKRGRLDLRQVIDAVRLAQFPNIDGFFLLYGMGDITPLIAYLKSYGMDVIAGCIEPDKNAALCNKVILLGGEEPVVKDVLKKGYKPVAPMSLVYIDSENEVVDDKVIEDALKQIDNTDVAEPKADEKAEEEKLRQQEIQKAEAETMAAIDNLVAEAEAEALQNEEAYTPSASEETVAMSDVKAPVEEMKADGKENEEPNAEDIKPNSSVAEDGIQTKSDDDFDESELKTDFDFDEAQKEEPAGEENKDIDDDALIEQLYKLLGGLD